LEKTHYAFFFAEYVFLQMYEFLNFIVT
jgi:hypothetical protein